MQPPWPCHQSVLSPSSVHSIESLSVVTFRFSVYPSSVLSNRSLFFNCSCCRRRCPVAVFFFCNCWTRIINCQAYLTNTKGMMTNPARITNTKPGNVRLRVVWYTLLKIAAPTSGIIAVTTPYTENREPKGRKIHTMTSALSYLCSNETSLKQTARPVSCCFSVIFFDAILGG